MEYIKKGRDIIVKYIEGTLGIPITQIQLKTFTLWYTFMSICIYHISLVYSSVIQLLFNKMMNFVYGLCCALSYIEIVGAWGFTIVYYVYYKSYAVKDIYYEDPETAKHITLRAFLIVDGLVHVIIPLLNIYLYSDYMNIYSILTGYILVRYWHYHYSQHNRIYSCPVDIYKFKDKNIPYWLWVVIWSMETTTALVLLKYSR
jgi:hypothetical protein